MPKRPGKTVKVSISVDREDLKLLRKRADLLHDGNLSMLMRELAEEERRFKAMDKLIRKLGGPLPVTDAERAEIQAEWTAPLKPARSRKAKRAA